MSRILKTVCPTNNDDIDADITSHDTYEKGFPHMAFKRMRDKDPCAWIDENDGGKGFWAVTRYNDIREVWLTKNLQFSSRDSTRRTIKRRV